MFTTADPVTWLVGLSTTQTRVCVRIVRAHSVRSSTATRPSLIIVRVPMGRIVSRRLHQRPVAENGFGWAWVHPAAISVLEDYEYEESELIDGRVSPHTLLCLVSGQRRVTRHLKFFRLWLTGARCV